MSGPADRSSPIVDWLRALARKAHAECGGKGVGAVGMCFTGDFALAMMTEPAVVAPVLSQPSLPLAMLSEGARAPASTYRRTRSPAPRARFEDEDLSMIGLRFNGDSFVPDARFETLKRGVRRPLRGDRNRPKATPRRARMPPHSVLTIHLREDGPTKAAETRVIAFLKRRTAAS